MIPNQQIASLRKLFTEQDERRFPPEALAVIYQNNWFKIFVPEVLGGLQMALPEAARLLEHLAYVDGDLGWAVQIGAGGGFFTPYLNTEIAKEYISDPLFVIAGSGMPTGKLIPHPNGGYQVEGLWRYCSGSGYASLFTFAVMMGGQPRAVALEPSAVTVCENWDAYGMRLTESHSVKVEGVLVDERQVFTMETIPHDYSYALYHLPFTAFARICVSSVLIGCFQHLLECAEEILSVRKQSEQEPALLAGILSDLKAENGKLREAYQSELDNLWHSVKRGKAIDEETLASFEKKLADYSTFIKTAAFQLFQNLGMRATSESEAVNKIWRDLTTASQHFFA